MQGTYADRPAPVIEGAEYLALDIGADGEEYRVVDGEWKVISPPGLIGLTELVEGWATRSTIWADVPDFLYAFTPGHRAVKFTLDADMSVSEAGFKARASIWVADSPRQHLEDFHPAKDQWQPVNRFKVMRDLQPGARYIAKVRLVSATPALWTRIDGNPEKPSTLTVEAI